MGRRAVLTSRRREEESNFKKEEEEEEEEEVTWANHYSSLQQILLVGEGDFSFSLALANAFGSAFNIVATSLDSHATLLKKYGKAKSNLKSLKKKGATILHKVDATKMKLHADLKMRKFDRIVFNFPHAGFKGREDQLRLINMHRNLVRGFFRNASHMLRPYGEVHVSHKTGGPFRNWNLEELASKNSLTLFEYANFNIQDYPGYRNKRGDGSRSDQPFRLGECCTYKFRIGEIHKKNKAPEVSSLAMGYPHETWPQTVFSINLEGIPGTRCCPPRIGISNVYLNEPDGRIFDACQVFRSTGAGCARSIEDPRGSYHPYVNESPTRSVSGYARPLEEFSREAYMRSSTSRHGPGGAQSIVDPRSSYQSYVNESSTTSVSGYARHLEEFSTEAYMRRSISRHGPGSVRSIEDPRSSYPSYVNESPTRSVLGHTRPLEEFGREAYMSSISRHGPDGARSIEDPRSSDRSYVNESTTKSMSGHTRPFEEFSREAYRRSLISRHDPDGATSIEDPRSRYQSYVNESLTRSASSYARPLREFGREAYMRSSSSRQVQVMENSVREINAPILISRYYGQGMEG